MINYILVDQSGEIRQRGVCQSEDQIPPIEGCRAEIIDASDPRQPSAWPQPSYMDYRRMGYPSIGDQLDTLWHAMDQGLLPQIPGFYDRIKAVKDANPKPPS